MKKGTIYAMGIGHTAAHITNEVKSILRSLDMVAGHPGFIDMCREYINKNAILIDDAVVRAHSSDFIEAQQNRIASIVSQALKGYEIGLLSGGDTGIWGEAAFVIEAQAAHKGAFDVRVVPGIPGMVACAARVGAPLMNGFALISIGDEDTPFSIVKKRLRGAAMGGFAIVLYKVLLESANSPEYYPIEKYPELYPPLEKNIERLTETYRILSEHIAAETPMAVITDVCDQTSNYNDKIQLLGSDTGREEIVITTFDQFLELKDTYRFFTTIIIGDNTTKRWENYIYTPQWCYNWEYNAGFIDRIKRLEYIRHGAFNNKAGVT